jgi:3D (Asp-Asp-Asp) domain-containing protein
MALAADNGNQDDVPIPIVAPAALVVEAPAEPTYTVVSTSLRAITAYTSEVGQCDESPCITANGFNVCKNGKEDVIAANFLKFGTKVRIPELFGDRIFIVQDRMNRRFPNKVDVWMKDKSDAIHFGIKTARIEVVVENK